MSAADASPGTIAFGVGVLAVALPVFWAVGRLAGRVRNARFARAWAPLVPVVDGTLAFDRTGSSSSLTGRYRGAGVHATMALGVTSDWGRGRTVIDGDVGPRGNAFLLTLRGVAGRGDWSVIYPDRVPLLGSDAYAVRADDPALVARLERAGVVALAERLEPALWIRYAAAAGTLTLREEVQPRWVPRPERFEAALDVLTALAALNATVNPSVGHAAPA